MPSPQPLAPFSTAAIPVLDSLVNSPFHLSPLDIDWVRRTRDAMGTADKLRQLFILVSPASDLADIDRLMAHRPAGVHCMVGADFDAAWHCARRILERAEVPPFITGDLEGGGHGFPCFTPLPNPLGLAAAADPDLSREVASVVAREGRALGFNWSFTPVADISAAIGSAIVGTRSFGSDIDTVTQQCVVHVQALQAQGVAATVKHWPGEGYDARDQHLVTTVNPLSQAEWMASFGHIYRALFEADVMTVMSAHIAWPAWLQRTRSGLATCVPACLSAELNQDLLRREMGFNGLVVSDATLMAGLSSWGDRATVVPQIIESGCDLFLFSRHEEADIAHMTEGLRSGRLSEQRLDDAVTRILGLKAALGLHRKSIDERLPPLAQARSMVRTAAHQAVAEQAASASVTLVKDVQGTLPLTPAKHRRVLVLTDEGTTPVPGLAPRSLSVLLDGLRANGFELRSFDPEHEPTAADTDLVLYLLGQESMLTLSRIHIDWRRLQPGLLECMQRWWHEIPTVMVSFGHPYHLYDAPRVPVYINAYSAVEPVQRAVLRKLLGDEPFQGQSPVDALCGLPDAAW